MSAFWTRVAPDACFVPSESRPRDEFELVRVCSRRRDDGPLQDPSGDVRHLTFQKRLRISLGT